MTVTSMATDAGNAIPAGNGKGRRPNSLGGGNRDLTRVGATVVAILAVAAIAVVLVFRFVGGAKERDLQTWQVRLGIVADSRATAVNNWLDGQFATLRGLAENEALKLYVGRVLEDRKSAAPTVTPEAQFLGNLLAVTAARSGFSAPPKGANVPANVRRVGVAGLALFDRDGQMLVGTPHFPAGGAEFKTFMSGVGKGKRLLFGPFTGPSGQVSIAFAEPIYRVQADANPANQIGVVIGVKPLGSELYPLLQQPGDVSKTQEAVLIRADGAAIRYLSPLKRGGKPTARTLSRDTPNLAAAFALETIGGFARKRDYRGELVLVTSRAIKAAPWVLMQKIDRTEAMGPSDQRAKRLLIILLLATALATAAAFALWRHGASRRARTAAIQAHDMAERFEHQSRFLSLLTDTQPNAIFVSDEDAAIRFANAETVRRTGIARNDMMGKSLEAVFGHDLGSYYLRLNREARERERLVSETRRAMSEDGERVYQSQHLTVAASRHMPAGTLVVEEDVTEAVTERERRLTALRTLVGTLVNVVDERDPNAADHSRRVAFVARAIAGEMELPDNLRDTAEFGGTLLNLGKILVPETLLTKKGKLTSSEMRKVRDSIRATAQMLEDVPFDGPVVDTLEQALLRYDGRGARSGPKGDEILVTARIVSVANSFVALVSRRAHRAGLSIDKAIATLQTSAGQEFDHKVVTALVNYLDNRGGRNAWASLKPPTRTPNE